MRTRTSSGPAPKTPRPSGWRRRAAIDWTTPPTRALDASRPPFYRWFPDGELNVCHNALDRHVDAGRGEQAALIYDSPGHRHRSAPTPTRSCATRSPRSPACWPALGVGDGDRVVIYMPMVPEAAVAMLACARIGAVHSVVFGGFAPQRAGRAHRRRHPEGDRVGVVRHRGQAGASRTSRCWTRRSRSPPTSRASCVILQRPQVDGRDGRRRPRLGRRDGRRRPRPTACRSRPPTRSTSSTRPAPPGSRRAWCATAAATPWR